MAIGKLYGELFIYSLNPDTPADNAVDGYARERTLLQYNCTRHFSFHNNFRVRQATHILRHTTIIPSRKYGKITNHTVSWQQNYTSFGYQKRGVGMRTRMSLDLRSPRRIQ